MASGKLVSYAINRIHFSGFLERASGKGNKYLELVKTALCQERHGCCQGEIYHCLVMPITELCVGRREHGGSFFGDSLGTVSL